VRLPLAGFEVSAIRFPRRPITFTLIW